jgi:hypothetical protein
MDQPFDAIGGAVPYTWNQEGLPAGLRLSPEGVLGGSASEEGTSSVDVSVDDARFDGPLETYPLYVGEAAACAGETIVSCGDTLTGTFEVSYFGDASYSERSTLRLCLVPDRNQSVGFTVEALDSELRVDVVDPGRTSDEMLYEGMGTYLAYVDRWDVEGIGINPYSFPNILDYEDMAVRAVVRAYDEGDYRVTVDCD